MVSASKGYSEFFVHYLFFGTSKIFIGQAHNYDHFNLSLGKYKILLFPCLLYLT